MFSLILYRWSLGVLLHCLQAMSFPFVKGLDHNQMLHNILGSPLAHGEIDNQVISTFAY
jgi:hypothetical protein